MPETKVNDPYDAVSRFTLDEDEDKNPGTGVTLTQVANLIRESNEQILDQVKILVDSRLSIEKEAKSRRESREARELMEGLKFLEQFKSKLPIIRMFVHEFKPLARELMMESLDVLDDPEVLAKIRKLNTAALPSVRVE